MRIATWRIALGVASILAAGAVGTVFALTPRDHVAPGCLWWTATTAGDVVAGRHGCLRGYVVPGGELAEGAGAGDAQLPIAYADPDTATTRPGCPFRPGDAVVVRYHAVYDDGRVIAVIDGCR